MNTQHWKPQVIRKITKSQTLQVLCYVQKKIELQESFEAMHKKRRQPQLRNDFEDPQQTLKAKLPVFYETTWYW